MKEIAARVIIDSPIGEICIAASEVGIVAVELAPFSKKLKPFSDSETASQLASAAAKQLGEYFDGQRKSFELELDLEGTKFQQSVWKEISKAGFGQSVSYAQIAARLGKPKAARAVGGAVGANPVPVVIGCHRVLGSSGRLTGYSGGKGLDTKRWLLKHEGLAFK